MHAFRELTTNLIRSRFSSANSVKRVLSLTALFTICSIMIGMVTLPGALSLSAKAYDLPPGTTTITGDMLHNIIGDSPTCYYVGANNEWVKVTGSFYAVEGFVGAGTTGISPNVWNGRNLCWYKFPVPPEYYTSTVISPIGMIDTNLHFSNVTYIDFGMVAYNSNKYLNLPVGTVRPYCYLDYYIGTNQNRLYAASDTTGEHMGSMAVRNNYPPTYNYFANFAKYEGAATDFYYTSISSACLREYGSELLLGIPAMIINSDYVLEVNGAPPTGGGGGGVGVSGVSSGKVTGSIGDQDVNVNVDITQDLPDWMYSAEVTDYDNGGFEESVTSLGSVDVEGMASGVSSLGSYDSGILWYALDQLFGQHSEIVLLLSGCGALCLFGFVLNRFGR